MTQLNSLIEELKRQPGDEVFTIRRKLEKIREIELKRGNAIKVTKEFVLSCTECNSTMLREDDYYLHLRKSHDYSDESASAETVKPRQKFQMHMQTLENLLTNYTEHYLDDGHYEIT